MVIACRKNRDLKAGNDKREVEEENEESLLCRRKYQKKQATVDFSNNGNR